MTETAYDRHAEFFVDFVDRGLTDAQGYISLLRATLLDCLGERLVGARVCDLCCGEGHLGRYLIAQGARGLTIVNNNAGNADTGLAALIKSHRLHSNLFNQMLETSQDRISLCSGRCERVV